MLGMESFNVLLTFYRKNFLVYHFSVKYMYISIKSYRHPNRKYMIYKQSAFCIHLPAVCPPWGSGHQLTHSVQLLTLH